MNQPHTILNAARSRAKELGLPYSGAVTPLEAWILFSSLPNARIIDVRTQAEWHFVGFVPGSELIEWKTFPQMALNPDFLKQLRGTADPRDIILFLCRSGVRSGEAASFAIENGYNEAFNILEGFEGDKDDFEQRGKLNGWRLAGLPWKNV